MIVPLLFPATYKLMRTNGVVYLTRFQETQLCLSILEVRTVSVPADFVAHRLSRSIADNVNVCVSTLQAAAAREDGVAVLYHTAWRGKRKALNQFRSSQDTRFGKFPEFFSRPCREPGQTLKSMKMGSL